MSKTEVGEQNLYFQMESIKETEAGIYEGRAGDSKTPATKPTADKFPQGTEEEKRPSKQHKYACESQTVLVRRLVFILTTTAAVALLTAVVCLILTLIMMTSRNDSTPSKDCAAADETVQNLLRRIKHLENSMSAMEAKMKERDNTVETFFTKHDSQVEFLQAQVNETANKVAIVDDVWVNMTNTHDAIEKKLDTEFTQLNKSIKELNNNDSKLTSTLNELRQNQILTNGMNERLAINVTQLEIHVQELRKASNNISNRAVSLEKGYTQMNILMKTLQAINGAQNASHEDLQSMQDRLRDSLTAVNATLFDKVEFLQAQVNETANKVEVLQAQVNETANKVAIVDDVWVNMTNTHDAIKKKLDTEFKQLNKSIKELSNNDSKLTSTVNELRTHQTGTERMNERLAINVTQLETHVQELRKTSNNISNRAASLENGYTRMNNLMKTLQAINGAQNASHEDIQSMHNRLRDSLTAVNATLFDKVEFLQAQVNETANKVEFLQAQVNETANKVAIVDGVWVNMTNTHNAFEKKLDTEFKQLKRSVKELNNNDSKLTSTVNELRQNQMQTEGMNRRLAINVTQLESHVQGLRKASNNISNRAASLEKGYTRMNNLMKTLQAINGAQNASHRDIQSMHNRLRDSLTTVNATLFDKLKILGSKGGKPAANLSACQHRRIEGLATTATVVTGVSEAFYEERKGQRAMGITCSTNYARFYKLSELTQGQYQFKCNCKGLSPVFGLSSHPKMKCYLHVWECPI